MRKKGSREGGKLFGNGLRVKLVTNKTLCILCKKDLSQLELLKMRSSRRLCYYRPGLYIEVHLSRSADDYI
jgi:hypothetical protein